MSSSVNEQLVTKQDLADAIQPLATKHDLEQLRSDTKHDLEQLRSDTKQDLGQLRSDTKQDLERLRSDTQQYLVELGDRLTETIRDSQTEVLRAFYDWSRPVEARLNRVDELAQRMSWLEQRIGELERGKRPFPNNPS